VTGIHEGVVVVGSSIGVVVLVLVTRRW